MQKRLLTERARTFLIGDAFFGFQENNEATWRGRPLRSRRSIGRVDVDDEPPSEYEMAIRPRDRTSIPLKNVTSIKRTSGVTHSRGNLAAVRSFPAGQASTDPCSFLPRIISSGESLSLQPCIGATNLLPMMTPYSQFKAYHRWMPALRVFQPHTTVSSCREFVSPHLSFQHAAGSLISLMSGRFTWEDWLLILWHEFSMFLKHILHGVIRRKVGPFMRVRCVII